MKGDDFYDMLLGGAEGPARMAAAAQRLRRQEALGTLGAMSGDPVLTPWGQRTLTQVPERRAQIEAFAQPRPTGNPEFFRQMGMNVPFLSPEERATRQAAKREHELLKVERKAEAQAAQREAERQRKESYVRPADWPKLADTISSAEALAAIVPVAEQTEDITTVWDVPFGWARSYGLEGLVNLLEPHVRSSEARSLRSAIAEIISGIRKGLFGTAFTQWEQQEYGKEGILSPGLSREDLIDRMRRTVEWTRRRARTHMGGLTPPPGVPTPPLLRADWETMWTPETAGEPRLTEVSETRVAPTPAPTFPVGMEMEAAKKKGWTRVD